MKINPFFVVFVVLVGALIYAYQAMDKKPEGAITATPRQYIEMVEKNKAERLDREKASRAGTELTAPPRDTGD